MKTFTKKASLATALIIANLGFGQAPSGPICSGTQGLPIFNENFGAGTTLYGPALAAGVTNYVYQTGVPNNGTYVIANTGNPSTTSGYVNAGDHGGNPNGYIMVVNADYGAGEAYRRKVTGLCPNTTYVFSSYLANNNTASAATQNCGSNYIYANVKFQVEFPTGTPLGFVTTGNLAPSSSVSAFNWGQYGFSFTTLAGQTSVDVVLINNAPGGCGNDFVVDDITLAPCGPGVALSITPNKSLFCSGEHITLQSTFTSGTYTSPQYQWQFSSNGGATWSNIAGATSSNYNIASVASSQGGMYQLLVAENGNINLPSCSIIAGPLSFSVIPTQTLTGNSFTYCPSTNTSVAISVTSPTTGGPWTYNWMPGNLNGNPVNVSPIVNTTYTATATSIAGCTSTVAVAVTISCTPSGCCIGNACTDVIKNPLPTNWEVALGNNNYVFNRSLTNTGKVGIGLVNCTPGNLLEVNQGVVSNISGLRLTDLKTATPLISNNKSLSIDANGDVILVSANPTGITNSCTTINYVPLTTTGGNLTCSQIFDNGTSVGIGATGPFNYTSLSVVGITSVPSTGTVKLFVNGVTKASAYFATSDQKFKKDITKIDNALDIIKKLEGKTYFWRANEFKEKGFNSIKQYGFIAQELEKIVPEAVAVDENGDRSVNYDMIIPILVQGTKEQLLVIDNLQKQINELKSMLQANLTNTVATNTPSQAVNLSDKNVIVLNQNVPNPFSESTVITYNIPTDFNKAQLHFLTSDGKLIKTIDITTKGQNTLNVFANDLSSGIYSYSLIIDEKVIETKRMIKQ